MIHMVFRVLAQALRIPTHVDHPFLSAFCDVSRIHVRDVSNPFVSARDITNGCSTSWARSALLQDAWKKRPPCACHVCILAAQIIVKSLYPKNKIHSR